MIRAGDLVEVQGASWEVTRIRDGWVDAFVVFPLSRQMEEGSFPIEDVQPAQEGAERE